jgi:uncharacterized protein (TIGR02145 family)
MLSRFFAFLMLTLFTSCAKEFRNPYDPATPPDIWMPKSFRLDTLGNNALRLSWNQEEQHIDGFAIQKTTNGQIKEILLPLDSLRYTDIQAVDTSSDEVCPELSYKVMARAGNNRSLDIGTTSVIRMPLSTPANAGPDVIVTDSTTTIQLNAQAPNAGERGQWTIISGAGGSFSNQNAHNSNFTGTPCTDYVLRWTKTGCTETFDEVIVKFQKSITSSNAGVDQGITSNSTQVTLSANSPADNETGTWSIVSGNGGNFANVNSHNSDFTGSSCTNYVLRWTINGLCSSSIDELNVNFQKTTTTANAGADQTISSNVTQVSLAANAPSVGETGSWSIVSGSGGSFANANSANSTFTGNACTIYSLRWTIQGLCSTNYDDVVISFNQTNTNANAGANFSPTTLTINLNANLPLAYENGYWEIISGNGGVFSNNQTASTSFTGLLNSTYILRWNIISPCISTSDDITISFPVFIQGNGVSDINQNFYPSVIIGNQEWMAVNLKTNRFCNGDYIDFVADSAIWHNTLSPAYTTYNNSSTFGNQFGKLYNWYSTVDVRNVCPCDWHVPTINEWNVLSNYLANNVGGKMKTTGTSIWLSPNTNATNASGFSGLPGGARQYFSSSDFDVIYDWGFWWSTTPYAFPGNASNVGLFSDSGNLNFSFSAKSSGLSIRCLKN